MATKKIRRKKRTSFLKRGDCGCASVQFWRAMCAHFCEVRVGGGGVIVRFSWLLFGGRVAYFRLLSGVLSVCGFVFLQTPPHFAFLKEEKMQKRGNDKERYKKAMIVILKKLVPPANLSFSVGCLFVVHQRGCLILVHPV